MDTDRVGNKKIGAGLNNDRMMLITINSVLKLADVKGISTKLYYSTMENMLKVKSF